MVTKTTTAAHAGRFSKIRYPPSRHAPLSGVYGCGMTPSFRAMSTRSISWGRAFEPLPDQYGLDVRQVAQGASQPTVPGPPWPASARTIGISSGSSGFIHVLRARAAAMWGASALAFRASRSAASALNSGITAAAKSSRASQMRACLLWPACCPRRQVPRGGGRTSCPRLGGRDVRPPSARPVTTLRDTLGRGRCRARPGRGGSLSRLARRPLSRLVRRWAGAWRASARIDGVVQ